MREIDANNALQEALKKRWRLADGTPNVGGYYPVQFDTSKVQLRLLTIEYPDLQKRLVKKPEILREDTITNNSGATLTHTFDYSKEKTDAYEWHVTGGLKLTAGAKATVGLPLVGEGEVSTSVELSIEGGSTTTHSETVAWKDSGTIEVPPHTSVLAQAVLASADVANVPFTANMYAFGQVGCLIRTGTDQTTWEWADLDAGGWYNPNFQRLSKLPLDPKDREFTIEGTFSGSVGFYVAITAGPVEPQAVGAGATAHVT